MLEALGFCRHRDEIGEIVTVWCRLPAGDGLRFFDESEVPVFVASFEIDWLQMCSNEANGVYGLRCCFIYDVAAALGIKIGLITDAFGVVTVVLVSVFIIFGLLCISYSVYFRSCIRKQRLLQLGYFNGPWITRIAFVLVAIWWGIWEVGRLSFLKGRGRLFTSLVWQKNICKYYILSNIGFAEPNLLLILVFLLRASLQKWKSGTLSRRWNKRTVCCAFLICLPLLILQLCLAFFGSKLLVEMRDHHIVLAKYFLSTSQLTDDSITCTYPLLSTVLLSLYDFVLMVYVSYFGVRMVSSAINKGLQKRACILIFSVMFFLPLRVILLGLTVLLNPSSFAFEAFVFLAFLMLLTCVFVGVCVLVYYPIADSLALRGIVHSDVEQLPFDDYYFDGGSAVANQSLLEIVRNSDSSTERDSRSFLATVNDEPSRASISHDAGDLSTAAFAIVSPPRALSS
ncbi:hypothetical protein Taro_054824 [Colocasia esculenta]|uniref:Uncharacterized protein n=1 Tax=Colocasia esculenta TaxID=4460 RepID=A0A843XPW9_COLES|nr:hypothetical protein [Colocasia esculenta]